jgi:hypothetical protein
MGVKSWDVEVKEELHNIGLAFVCRKQQEREMLRLVKKGCNDSSSVICHTTGPQPLPKRLFLERDSAGKVIMW